MAVAPLQGQTLTTATPPPTKARANEATASGSPSPSDAGASTPPVLKLNPTGHDIALSAPLRDGQFLLGEVAFRITKDDVVFVHVPSLLIALKSAVDPAALDKLAATLGPDREVPVDRVAAAGFPLHYDPQAIALAIEIPGAVRPQHLLRLSQSNDSLVGDFDAPAGVSGYLNLRSSFDYAWQGSDKGLVSPLIDTDWALRAKNVVFEGEGSLQIGTGGQQTNFQRTGSRFIYDDARLLARFTAGDLVPVSRGFSGASQLSGLSIERLYSILEPQRNVQPTGSETFSVTRPSTVQAFINGQMVRQMRLDPGSYNVRDFPFVQGLNDVQLVITDDAGHQETVNFSLSFDRTLLAKGLTEFGLYAGVLSPTKTSGRSYKFNEPAANGFIRRGLTDTLTAGANFQAQKRGATVGAEMVWANPIGTIGFDLAGSHVSGIGTGYAFNGSFQRIFGGTGSHGKSLELVFETRSKDFATPADDTAQNRYAFETGITYSQSIGQLQYFSIDGRYGKSRQGFKDEETARVTYGYRLSPRINIEAEGTYDTTTFAKHDWGIRFTVTFRRSDRTTATAEYDSSDGRGRLGYQTSRGEGVGQTSIAADVDYGHGDAGLDGAVSYLADRAELAVSHTTSFDGDGMKISDQRTSARVGTAIVFADGHFALSRPIYDSFALVVPHKTLDGAQVVLNPSDGHVTSRSGTFGGAVENDLSSYTDRVVTFDVPKAPAGYDLGAGNARVLPPYKAGYLVTVGSEYSMTAIGTLLDPDGQPVSLLAGEAYEVAKPDAKPLVVFTNRDGRFGLSGLRPGKWRLEMPTEPASSVIITIPQDAHGVVRVGTVKLENAR